MAHMEAMSPVDSSFLHIEDATTPMHIGGVSLFEGPAPAFEDLRAMVEGKLGLVPRYRQKVRFVRLGAGQPVWIDDPHFNLDFHVRHTAVPAPGTEVQLRKMANRVFSQRLDRTKPLWELWMIEGLDEGRWALLSKVLHCMVDGVAATDLMSVMFSDITDLPPAEAWSPAPEPSGVEVLVRSVTQLALSPSRQLGGLREALRAPRETLATASPRSSRGCRSASTIRPGASSRSARRWTGSSSPSRRSPGTC